MSPRAILLTLATLFAVAGLSFGLATVHDDSNSCGSVFRSGGAGLKFQDAIDGGDAVDGCHQALGDRKPLVYGALGIAALALVVGVAASGNKPTNADGSEKPSIWR